MPLNTQGGIGGLGGHICKSLGKLLNGCTDWHQIWSNLRIRLGMDIVSIQFTPQYPTGVLGGHKFKSIGKLSNSWNDWHRSWYTSADSSGNGYTPKYCPSRHNGALGGGFRGSNIQNSRESVKRLDRLAPTLVHVCGLIWEWIYAK